MKRGDTVKVPDGRIGRITIDWMKLMGVPTWHPDNAHGRYEVYFGNAYRNRCYNENELTGIREART